MHRLLVALVTALALLPTKGIAGDTATLTVHGFTDGGRQFVFEEHGVQDGSGFPYTHIYMVDVAQSRWVGPPVRMVVDDMETLESHE